MKLDGNLVPVSVGTVEIAETVVELTQAQYDALAVYDNNTYYLIVEE